MAVDDDDVDPKVLMRPAACHVVPLVRACFSSRRTSGTPSFARWYATEAPMMPPPITTTLASLGTVALVVVDVDVDVDVDDDDDDVDDERRDDERRDDDDDGYDDNDVSDASGNDDVEKVPSLAMLPPEDGPPRPPPMKTTR